MESRGVSKERKTVRKDVQQNIDEVLPKWSMNQRSMNSIISGSILQAKAEELPKLFNVAEFRRVGYISSSKTSNELQR